MRQDDDLHYCWGGWKGGGKKAEEFAEDTSGADSAGHWVPPDARMEEEGRTLGLDMTMVIPLASSRA